ncbi:uncharacterized protein LOC135467370 [Liolophura sinensis]|uniref:uncharacterized protein LOC135467370 n=1 Tax=Liolophura sinensis TaxID=3198878 RepID=UPI00315958BB
MYQVGVKVDETLLKSEVALLTGGRDISGHPVITFPASNVDKLAEIGSAGLVQLIRYYFSVSKVSDQQQGFAFVADLQLASQEGHQVLVEALEFLQSEKKGCVANVYFLKPKSRTKSRVLKKLLGLKESKKNPKVSSFPCTPMKAQSELYSRIDRTQLTEDLGGTLHHNHQAWLQFHYMIDPLMESVMRCQSHLPAARDKVQLLQDYDTAGLSSYQLQTLVKELEDKYHAIMRELDVESAIDWCKQMIQRLEKPDGEVVLSQVSPLMLADTITLLKQATADLVRSREEMATVWKDTESHFQRLHQLFHFKRETTALCDDIARLWLPKVEQPANIGTTLSHAEMYRTYFVTSLYDPAKMLVSQATELLEGIHELRRETPSLESELDFLPGLTQLVQTFAEKLERLHNTYMAIHIFFLMFEKLAQWYQKVLRFFPSTLAGQVEKAKKQGKSSIPVLPKWAQAVRSFLNKHPGPRNEHIGRIEYPVSILPDAQLCSQARLLAHRIRSLNKLLTSTQQFPLSEISNALIWKRRSLEGNDDIVIPSQVDPPLNKSYNTERDLDREVADIGDCTSRDEVKSDLLERPATALGITDKKNQSVTFADDLETTQDSIPAKREISKSSQDLTHQNAVENHAEQGMRTASSFDILTENGTSSLRMKGERFVSLGYGSELPSLSSRYLHGTLPKSNRFKLPPSELEKIFERPVAPLPNTGTVVEQLQQIMNSGLSADEKLQHAQLVLQASTANQPPQSPFVLGGNLSNQRYSFQGSNSHAFYDLSPRHTAVTDWTKLSEQDTYGTLTKSMPNLDEVATNGRMNRKPPAYNLATALNGHNSEVELSSGFNSSPSPNDRSGPQEVKSARELRSAQRVDDWVEQHAQTVHQHCHNLDADAETDDGYSDGSTERQRRRQRKSRQDRMKDDTDQSDNARYGDLLLETRNQDEVESSLRRAQKILEDEELNLKERQAKYRNEHQVENPPAFHRRDSNEVTSALSLDESADLPDSDQIDSPGLSLDSSKSDRTVPSVSTDHGYNSSSTQPDGNSKKKSIFRKHKSSPNHDEITRTISSDSTGTMTSQDPSPTPDMSTPAPSFLSSMLPVRTSPLNLKERRKSILRQAIPTSPIPQEKDDTAPDTAPNQLRRAVHMPVIRGSCVSCPLQPSKSMQDLLSIGENDNTGPLKLRSAGAKTRAARSNRRLSLITFSPNQKDISRQNEALAVHNRRLSMETIVEVPKQEETVFRDSAEARAQRRRRKRSDLKLGSLGEMIGTRRSSQLSSSDSLAKGRDEDSSTSNSEGRSQRSRTSKSSHRNSSGSETERVGQTESSEPWDWNTKPGPSFNLVDSFRHKSLVHMKNSSHWNSHDGSGTGRDSPPNRSTNNPVLPQPEGAVAGHDEVSEGDREARPSSKSNDQNDTDDDINKLSGFEEWDPDKPKRKAKLRRDAPSTKCDESALNYTMRGTRGTLGSTLPKQYVRKNSRVFDSFHGHTAASAEGRANRGGKMSSTGSASGHRLIADDAWSLYR